MDWEAVVGLEVHAELATESKLFCGCATTFGAEPNTQTCPVCLGLPGALPVLNRQAVELALRAARVLGCRINRRTAFDRKNYYYPDLPKNYQISQNYAPLGVEGRIRLPLDGGTKDVRIHNVHLEEDAGKLIHPEDAPAAATLVDLNRAGTPLLEIVTAPDLRSVEEVEAFMRALRSLLLYTRVSDCRMEQGSLRFEASVSLRPRGAERLGSRVEIKNLNSLLMVQKAVRHEIERQRRLLESGRSVEQETRLWDDASGRTERMRTKEEAHDYRYFPEPDLVPVIIDEEWLAAVEASLPELPAARRARFIASFGLSAYEADLLTADRALADFFEACLAKVGDAKKTANWLLNQTLAALNEARLEPAAMKMTPDGLARLIARVDGGAVSALNAAELLPEMVARGADPDALIERHGLRQIRDEADIAALVTRVLAENARAVADWRAGKSAAFNALLGAAMRLTRGRADAARVREALQRRLAEG